MRCSSPRTRSFFILLARRVEDLIFSACSVLRYAPLRW